jgi:cell division transport system permease protein
VLLVITLLLLNNTIRLAIYAKRYLINTMKLVGATKWYIMRPFLGSAFWQGLWAGLAAGVMVIGLVHGAQRVMPVDIEMLSYQQAVAIIGVLVLLGIIITIAFSAAAVNKFVNMKTNKIHLY